MLYEAEPGSADLGAGLRRLERNYEDAVHSELIYLLSHLRFEEVEARSHWLRILAHRDAMQERLGATVDLRVALLSYFLEVCRKLKNPKVIELKLFEETQASAYRDDLTGLDNFRSFREHLAREIRRGARAKTPLSLVMIDIDNFKHYNDRFGHDAGNRVLAAIAGLLRQSLRQADVPARYGGEEFALILPATQKTAACEVAERTREQIERHPFPRGQGGAAVSLTVSMGIATCPADAQDPDELVRRSDSALYYAKSRGKNQVHLYGESRRSYQRISAALQGRLHSVASEPHPFTTVNLSETGLLLLVGNALPIGSLVDITLLLPEPRRDIRASGRVIRVEERAGGRYEAAVRIIDIAAPDQLLLAKYLQDRALRTDTNRPA
jgi:diguanylate cyclase (GGDEF)-like protein